MDDPGHSTSQPIAALLDDGAIDDAVARVERLADAPVDARKAALRELRAAATDAPEQIEPLVPPLATLLEDDDRSVRLTAAKLFCSVAEAAPAVAVPVVPDLAARLGDDDEFYFVRARSAEALGYVAVEHPDEVASPAVVADLRVGLAFDEPEVRAKLAKALAYVALGDLGRLRHRVADLATHLEADDDLVRFYLTTALAAVGCEFPDELTAARDALAARLDDENAYVRGRAAEALGCHARSATASLPRAELATLAEDDEPFVATRAAFAVGAVDGAPETTRSDDAVGRVEGIRETVEDAAARIAAPPAEVGCPHCGLELPDPGPPLCPGCGAPR